MKAISLWQPWANLVIYGDKRIETRSWKTNYRGRIAIHATRHKKFPHEVWAAIADTLGIDPAKYKGSWLYYTEHGVGSWSFGVILGTVGIVDCVPIEELYGTEYDTPKERALGDWSEGRYGWILKAPERFKQPIPARGAQGLWTWEHPDGGVIDHG